MKYDKDESQESTISYDSTNEDMAKIKLKKKDVIIGVLGCMAQSLKHDLLENKPYVDIILGPDSYRKLPILLNRSQSNHSSQVDTTLSRFEVYDNLFPSRQEGINAWISIMRGCNKFCTFCIVPFTFSLLVLGRPFPFLYFCFAPLTFASFPFTFSLL